MGAFVGAMEAGDGVCTGLGAARSNKRAQGGERGGRQGRPNWSETGGQAQGGWYESVEKAVERAVVVALYSAVAVAALSC